MQTVGAVKDEAHRLERLAMARIMERDGVHALFLLGDVGGPGEGVDR